MTTFWFPLGWSRFPLKFQREGIKYDDLSDDEKAEWDEQDWGEGAPPAAVEAGALNTWLFNLDTIDKALEYLMTHGQKVASGDRLGKTIIFAKNREHAQLIVERFDANYPHLKGSFTRAIDYKTTYAQSLIDDFSTTDKPPHIAVSIDMLDTGIDIPEIVNLVFFKVVRSKTKFWQMLGRGTRLRPSLFGPGFDKAFFFVFDFCENFEFFNERAKVAENTIADSLAKRLFAARVKLVAEIVDTSAQTDPALAELASTTTERLRSEVAAMSLDNFLVRPKRRLVEKYAELDGWGQLDPDAQEELTKEVAGLPTALVDDDQDAKQFDLLLLRAELAALRADGSLDASRVRIIEVARLLEGLDNIPSVAAEMELILELQTGDFWDNVAAPMLEGARRRLRLLIKLIDVKKRQTIYTDFIDEIGIGTEVTVEGVPVGTDMVRYRQRAAQLLRANDDHLAVRKVRMNEALTAFDLAELERIFVEAGLGTPDELTAVTKSGGLGAFVRSLVGLDRGAAKAAFASFLSGRTPNVAQLEFVNTIIEHLTARGIVEARLLYESPFTDIDPMGVSGVFPDRDVAEIVGILDEIQKRAAA
jgi:type I restriction enzyme R subunit